MKKISLLLALAALVCCAMLFGCETDEPKTAFFKVTFELDGGTCLGLTEKELEEGSTFDLTEIVPAKENYIFDGWTIDGVKTEKIAIEKDVTVKAVWKYLFDLEEADGAYAVKGIKAEYKKDELVLPEEFEGKKITSIKTGALENAKNVRSIVIGNGYQTLEPEILSPLVKLEKISLPFWGTKANPTYFRKLFASGSTADEERFVVSVGADESYLVPKTLVSVCVTGGSVVPETKELRAKELVFASSEVTEIENRTFNYDPYIETIDLGGCKNLEKIGDSNFSDCKNLRSVSLAGLDKLCILGSHSFYYYVPGSNETHAFERIDLSGLDSLETVGQMSFWYLDVDVLDFSETAIRAFGRQTVFRSAIKKIDLPATFDPLISDENGEALGDKFGLDYINNSEFLAYCTGLSEITVDKLSLYAKARDGVLYDYDLTTVVKYANAQTAESFVAPSSLKTIRSAAFENAAFLKTIDLSGCKLECVDRAAFSGCDAKLIVGFDKYGYYATDGSKVNIEEDWSGNCAVTYGERYNFFTITEKGIKDGMVVASGTLSFDLSATYGDFSATVTVTVNGEPLERGENGFTATLIGGENVICAVASANGKTSDEKRYKVTLDESWTIVTDYEEGSKIVWADGNLTFKVSATNSAGVKQNVKDKVVVEIDCGYSGSFGTPFAGISVSYNADYTVATVEFYSKTLLMWDYDVSSAHHIRVTINQSDDVSVILVFDAQYFEKAPAVSSETPADNNTVSGKKWTIRGECKAGSVSYKIAEITAELSVGDDFFGNVFVVGKLSDGGMSFEVDVDLDSLVNSWFYFGDGDSFRIKVTLKLDNGLTATGIFNAEYSE